MWTVITLGDIGGERNNGLFMTLWHRNESPDAIANARVHCDV